MFFNNSSSFSRSLLNLSIPSKSFSLAISSFSKEASKTTLVTSVFSRSEVSLSWSLASSGDVLDCNSSNKEGEIVQRSQPVSSLI